MCMSVKKYAYSSSYKPKMESNQTLHIVPEKEHTKTQLGEHTSVQY